MKKILFVAVGALLLIGAVVLAVLLLRCDHQWLDATCDAPSTCSSCKATRGEPLGHHWQNATCTVMEHCARCNVSRGAALGHSWQEATCLLPKLCTVCGHEEGSALGHSWQEATCTAPRVCTLCGQTQGEPSQHTWSPANCLAPATCSFCGLTQGEITDHQWRSATCTAAQTCTVCKKTVGSALGHRWREATCTKAESCTVCGKTSGNALGHRFAPSADGKSKQCQVCNQAVTIKYAAITFDDGPSGNITKSLLEGLKARNVHATFFLCGYRIKTYGDLPQTILNHGHEIGLHTSDHATLTTLSKNGIRAQLEGMLPLLPEGCRVTLMRPPGGAYNNTVKEVCQELGLSVIMWSVDPKDWASSSANTIADRIVNGAYDGSIILAHDMKSANVQGALKAIDRLQAQGYEFVTVSQLAQIKGKQLQAGAVYHSVK